MPIYEYVCTKCSHQLEALQSMSEAALTRCPECEEEALTKGLFSAPNFQLKGKGWYKTDYAKSSATSKPEKDQSEASETS